MAKLKKIFKNVGHAYDKLDFGVYRKFRRLTHTRGKNFQSMLGAFRPSSSASGVAYSDNIYGPSGSIVGRY